MADTKYILRYLPLFYEELEEKVVYIAETLKNPQASNAKTWRCGSFPLQRISLSKPGILTDMEQPTSGNNSNCSIKQQNICG